MPAYIPFLTILPQNRAFLFCKRVVKTANYKMLDIDVFNKILKEENIEIQEEQLGILLEFTDILSNKILDNWTEDRYGRNV